MGIWSEVFSSVEDGKRKHLNLSFPKIFALTSNSDPEIVEELIAIGFTNVYSELNEKSLREMFQKSNLIFNDFQSCSYDGSDSFRRNLDVESSSNDEENSESQTWEENNEESEVD